MKLKREQRPGISEWNLIDLANEGLSPLINVQQTRILCIISTLKMYFLDLSLLIYYVLNIIENLAMNIQSFNFKIQLQKYEIVKESLN